MKLAVALDARDADHLSDVSDDELLAAIRAELPHYLGRRLLARLPLIAGGLALAIVVSLSRADSEPTSAAQVLPAPTAPSTAPGRGVTATTGRVPPAAIPSSRVPPSGSPTSPFTTPPTTQPGPVDPPSAPSGVGDGGGAGLQIVDGGYGSATGGTPLERDPGHGGLPVGAAAGETLRYSFIRMTGEGTTLRLALDGAATNVGSEIASIDACTVTDEAWTAERGEPMAEAPQVGGSCVAGERLPDGTWRFDLASIDGGAGREGGIALVPSAAAAGQTFEIVFAPFAIGS